MAGQVVHFELPFDDAERAKAFYGDVFGWSLADMPGMAYTYAMTAPSDDASRSRSCAASCSAADIMISGSGPEGWRFTRAS